MLMTMKSKREKIRLDSASDHDYENATQPVGQLASFWNFPIFSQASTDPVLEDKSIYKTLIRLGPPFNKLGRAFVEIFNYFNWRRVVMISRRKVDNKRVFCDYSSRSSEEVFRTSNIKLDDWIQIDDDLSDNQIDDLLTRIRQRGRIVILCTENSSDKRNILLRAHAQGMMDGTYVYFTPDHLPPADVETPWIRNDKYDDKAKEAFTHVFQVTVAEMAGVEVENFRDLVSQKMADPPWNYNHTLQSGIRGSEYSPFLHDVVYLYLLVLHETLAEGVNHRNGSYLFEKCKGKAFRGKTGYVVVDAKGDRNPDYWMWDLQPGWNKFRHVMEVQMTNSSLSTQRLHFYDSLVWHTDDGRPPPDTPLCGFSNDLCKPGEGMGLVLYSVISVTVTLLLATSVIIIFIVYKRRQFEKEMKKQPWIVKYDDISFSKTMGIHGSISMLSLNTDHSTTRESSISKGSFGDNIQVFSCVGAYKGTMVAIRKLEKLPLLQREDHIELKIMKHLTHENVNAFLGICTDERGPCVLTLYCTKGSLQDIIENEDIKLDWMFKLSLITDLVNGLSYIHHSALKMHGNLKSSNCLVDNRWVLKLTDFGLSSVRRANRRTLLSEYQLYRAMFWTAPENLTSTDPLQSVKGDVYSLGVILFEILHRSQPYDTFVQSPQEVIEKVKKGEKPPFRPSISYGLADEKQGEPIDPASPTWVEELMQQTWNEDPALRPSLNEIKSLVFSEGGGKKISIVDNMISMLEKYANNLEDIVEQRTGQLVDEKKKTDLLLYRMLPPTVADRLKSGENVEAEIFSSVTIYFSDIVGFTALSAASTPIQIVALLNDLYSTFDSIIGQFDVYKVETIGDAYMVVSGLPVRNGNRHATEIAKMSLRLLESMDSFKVNHKPNTKLRIRIGLHSGSCAAGVVGLTMPRYCLFGDTVNMASRMESNGEALKIHMSEPTRDLLAETGLFQLTYRGEIDIKGKGLQRTYWLDGYVK